MILVYGSNEAGIHGAGAARTALKYHGAVMGIGVGLQGNSYGIPTKDANLKTLPLDKIQRYVNQFIIFAGDNPELPFKVTRIGCGLAGLKDIDIAPMFVPQKNVWFDSKWEKFGLTQSWGTFD
jgi:hypothetical protein